MGTIIENVVIEGIAIEQLEDGWYGISLVHNLPDYGEFLGTPSAKFKDLCDAVVYGSDFYLKDGKVDKLTLITDRKLEYYDKDTVGQLIIDLLY